MTVPLESNDTIGRSTERRMLARLVLFCACVLLIAVGITATTGTGATTPPPVLDLGDVSDATIVEIRDHRGAAVLSGEFRSRIDMLGNTEKDAALTDRRGQPVIGEVEIEIPAKTREHRRSELEVDIIGLPPRETFTVAIDDRIVGAFRTDDRGSVDMELQEGEMPGIEAGSGNP